jgi:ATPase family protein associated with various cellular activities (AAA)
MNPDSKEQMPLIFLAGPPGSGKSSLGKKACQKLELRFVDLSAPNINNLSFLSQKEILTEVINKRSADVIALPWSLQQDKWVRTLARRFGVLLLLWAHPLDMQARSGHLESLFTPSSRIKTKGGFGRNGTGCREFRRLDNASDEVLILVGSSFDEAVGDLQDCIVSIREESLESPVIRAGLSDLADDWQQDYDISKNIANIIVDAMARYILYLRSEGKSPRTLSGVYSDLEAAGMLVIAYDYPTGKKAAEVLDLFSYPPWTIEFKRKFSDSSNAIARYERNLKGFARFLKNS